MGKRDLGGMAENQLRLWASSQAIVCNPAVDDKLGWDFHLQFRAQNEGALDQGTLDLRPPELTCLVQVKGFSKKDAKRLSLKLSNWERLVKTPLPVFYLLLEFGEGDAPTHAYLVHLDREQIGRVLKRLRRPGKKALHKQTLDLKWSRNNRLSAATAEAFRSAVEGHVGPDPRRYFDRKRFDVATVGYDEHRIRGTFRVCQWPRRSA